MKETRLKTGYTQKKFGELMGISPQFVTMIERGSHKPTKVHKASLKMMNVIIKHKLLGELNE